MNGAINERLKLEAVVSRCFEVTLQCGVVGAR